LNPEVIKIWKKAYRKIGVEYLASFPCWVQDGLWGKKAFKTVADFKGNKIRTSGLMQELSVKSLGGEAISMPSTEMEEALYRGTIDGLITGRGWGYMLGLPDIVPAVSVWPLAPCWNMALVVNSQSFDSLTPELQEELQETAEEVARQNILCAETELNMMIKAIELAKIQTTIPSKEEIEKAKALANPVYNKWLELTGADGGAVLEAAKESVKEYRAFSQ
jgi:TRAP-type C4-dicarboxylate transport system substrate-binding protein